MDQHKLFVLRVRATEASLRVACVLGKHKKPLSDALFEGKERHDDVRWLSKGRVLERF